VTTEDPTAEHPTTPEVALERAAGRGAVDALGDPAPTAPLDVPTRTVTLIGTGLWAVALVVTLLVPSLHTGERSWWPWTCVTGIALGVFALWYLGRGKGRDAV